MNVSPRRPLFNRRPQSNIYRMFVWVVMLLGCVWILQQVSKGNIRPLLQPTPIPTRAIQSYLEEGEASFSAGNLNQAITSYQEALKLDPNDAQTWAKLARIQTYSSIFLTTSSEKKARLLEALDSANKAVALAPEDSTAHAILAFTLDWNANSNFHTSEEVQAYLQQIEATYFFADQNTPESLASMIEYYRKRVPGRRRAFRATGIAVIVIGATLPFIAALGDVTIGDWHFKKDLIVSGLAVALSIFSGFAQFFRWDESWRGQTRSLFRLQRLRATWELQKAKAFQLRNPAEAIALLESGVNELIRGSHEVALEEMDTFFSNQRLPGEGSANKPAKT